MSTHGNETEARLVQVKTGRKVSHKGPRAFEARNVTIDRVYQVYIGDTLIGEIEYRMLTRERKSKGNRYVNARWQSPGWVYRPDGDSGRSLEAYFGRKDAIKRLTDYHERASS